MVSGEVEALTRLGAVLVKLGALAEARSVLAEAHAAGAGEAVRMIEAEALVGEGDPAAALEALGPLLEGGGRAEAWALAARAALCLGAQRDAAIFLARAKALVGRPLP